MLYSTVLSLRAHLIDHDGVVVSSEQLVRKLDGFACHTDSVLNYTELSFKHECGMRGGHPRLAIHEKQHLVMTVEVDSQRKLTREELDALQKDFEGQLTDGIGAGCFDELTAATGLGIQMCTPSKAKCSQTEGTAWRPKSTTESGNKKRIAAVVKLVERLDSKLRKTSPSRPLPTREEQTSSSPVGKNKPNLNKLFRFLAKPERDQLFEQVRVELECVGNDLTQVSDGEYPYGNFNDPKLLRLLLAAGLPPETTDVKGNSLLIQAASNPKCIELLLKAGVNVNRVCDSSIAATALMRAASLGKLKSVVILLNNGADPTIKNKAGRVAIDVVDKRSRDRQAILDLLKAKLRN